jgi:hypothetical protein
VADGVRSVLIDAALLVLLALLAREMTRPPNWKRALRCGAALLALCAALQGVHTPGEFFLQYAVSLATAAGGIVFCWFFARRNYLAYAFFMLLTALRAPMMELIGTGDSALVIQGWLIAGIMVAALAWAVAPAVLGRRPANVAGG